MEDVRYCVYLHKRADNGTVYYIGSGVKNKREYHFSNRSKDWHAIHDNYGTIVEIYKDNLTVNEARDLEEQLILSQEYKDIVNKKPPVKVSKIDVNSVKDFIKYDESSPTFLTWVKKTGPRSKVDTPAGNLGFTDGLPRSAYIKINGTMYKISRLIWSLFNGEIPENYVIDHIDGNPHNNNINNLRCISVSKNSRNRSNRTTEKRDLPNGVYFSESKNSIDVTVAYLEFKESKCFSLSRYTYEEATRKAIAWRIHKLKELGIFDEYSERHLGFDPEEYENYDFEHKTQCSSGYENIWVKRKDGKIVEVNGGLGRINRRYVKVNDKVSYEEALRICLEHVEKQKQMAIQYRKELEVSRENSDNAA